MYKHNKTEKENNNNPRNSNKQGEEQNHVH